MKKYLFYLYIIIAITLLVFFALSSNKKSNAIIASVESQKTAISFRKPVQIKTIYVNPGQHVSKGDLLLEVERPDLLLDRSKMENDKERQFSKKVAIESDYRSKVKLLEIEVSGKIQRLQADISKLESEIRTDKTLYESVRSFANGDSLAGTSIDSSNFIMIHSINEEIENLRSFQASEKNRYRDQMNEELKQVDLELALIAQNEEALKSEEATLKQLAPFDGTIGNINAQLMEIVPPYQTIISLYEQLPSTITAFVNLSSGYELSVGQEVSVESATRDYKSLGEVIEIGSRIVDYKDPTLPPNQIPLFGKEVFIKLPPDNQFLYGEQVFVFLPQK